METIGLQTGPVSARRFMWVTPGRVLYAGLLGAPSLRRLGGWVVYFSGSAPLRLAFDDGGDWRIGELAVVPPYRPHRIATDGRHLSDLILEPESIALDGRDDPLAVLLRGDGGVFGATQHPAAALLATLRDAHGRLAAQTRPLPADDDAFDRFVFGTPLPASALDPRIAQAVALLQQAGAEPLSGEALAAATRLSFSRFVHLFKQEVGVPLRTYRTWKRARSLLQYVTQDVNLTEIAQHAGYPDSAHFSRSIRQVFGLQPKEVLAGSRRLSLHAAPDAVKGLKGR